VVADLLKVAVEGGALLFSVDGVFSGINIDDESPFVPVSKQGIGRSVEAFFESFRTLTRCEDVVLKATECGSPGPTRRGLEFVSALSC
jgi:hypothetical protein